MSAVLFSGGLDSAVLLALERRDHDRVCPVHVRAGLAWEDAEARVIERLLGTAPFAGRVEPLTTLALDMRDVYPPTHWAVLGRPPSYDTPDEDVYLDGRNIMLAAKAAVWCARHGVGRLALGPLAGLHKEDVVRLGLELGVPLELTLSCMNADGDRQCGRCSKCRERADAFRLAGVEDAAARR